MGWTSPVLLENLVLCSSYLELHGLKNKLIAYNCSVRHSKFILSVILIFALAFPAYADFGCHFIVNKHVPYILDAPNKKISFRFTCRDDMGVVGASVYCEKALNSPSYLVSLREDVKGKPATTILGKASIVPQNGTWATLPLPNVSLVSGKAYHLVVEWDSNRGGIHPVGMIGPKNNASFTFTDTANHVEPYDETGDPNADVLVSEGNGWKELERQPLYLLNGGGDLRQGDPYDSPMAMPIHGNGTPGDEKSDLVQGEALHPHCELRVSGFAIRVKKQGNPGSPLNYRVYSNDYMKHVTTLSFSGKALDPDQVGAEYGWVTIGLDTPKEFPTECTYILFQTDSGRAAANQPGCEDCYVLSGATNTGNLSGASETTFDGGAHLSRAAYSTDGGAHILDEFEGDANVILLGPLCPEKEKFIINPLPEPSPLPRSLNP